ncbi:hypothetical protein [Frigoriflavimonas asaccharolytica]|uniref:Small-conductance mechanosensitive channel n=1 Tax=Frigoriflavimonas asaccharolytica TaxID=2735899 RepID=A0A8J8KCW6_9FLAO|nr:hypothetical protein [Frigoriflavimonas asaccharolytica]NRS94099.1 small-conductance mechanosensitive channel [Frigoriflavimonas asaccharolytica]
MEEIQKNEILKRYYENVRNYKDVFPLILILPTLIGGFWQLLELVVIDPAFLRFFSVSQLIPDGLLILAIVAVVYLMFKISNWHYNFKKITEIDNLDKFSLRNLFSGIAIVLMFALILGYYYFILQVSWENFTNLSIVKTLFILFINIVLNV